jgi:SAM-dependent methyltransferase
MRYEWKENQSTMPDQDYVLGHSHPEIDRLKRQAEMLRPITERLLVSAGNDEGMRVLDIGCGPGDVSMLIADLVGRRTVWSASIPVEQHSMPRGNAAVYSAAPMLSSSSAVSPPMTAEQISMLRYADTS